MVGAGLERTAAWRGAGSRSLWGVGPVRQEVQDGLEQDMGEQRWVEEEQPLGENMSFLDRDSISDTRLAWKPGMSSRLSWQMALGCSVWPPQTSD